MNETQPKTNVVAFRLKPEPELQFIEFRLDEDGICGLQMTLVDESGNVIPLVYKLIEAPADFDLDRLRAKWIGRSPWSKK